MAVTMLLLSLVLVIWPHRPRAVPRHGGAEVPDALARRGGSAMLSRLSPAPVGVDRPGRRAPRAALVLVGGMLGSVVSWPCGIAAAIGCATGIRLVTRARRASRARRDLVDGTAALRALARELRAGAPASDAVERTAASAPPRIADALRGLTSEPVPSPASGSILGEISRRLHAAGTVSGAHGVPLSTVVESLVGDLADRAQIAEATTAQVAGPAVSGYVLAALPAVGLLLGAGMGSHPVEVLTGSAIGGALLVGGTVLCCTGLLWADRIVRGSV